MFVPAARSRPRDRGADPVTLAETVLRDQGMPWDEIRIVSTTGDRELIRRHLELHVERLEELLSDQRRKVAAVERVLAEATERQVGSAGRASQTEGSDRGFPQHGSRSNQGAADTFATLRGRR
jgi:hypothetical protein